MWFVVFLGFTVPVIVHSWVLESSRNVLQLKVIDLGEGNPP